MHKIQRIISEKGVKALSTELGLSRETLYRMKKNPLTSYSWVIYKFKNYLTQEEMDQTIIDSDLIRSTNRKGKSGRPPKKG